jgi:hypothetical protein
MWIFNTEEKFLKTEQEICKKKGYPKGKTLNYANERIVNINGEKKWIMPECNIKVDYDDKLIYNTDWEK